MFWWIFSYDRNLVAPETWDAFYPVWLNHFVHTNIVIFLIVELFILHRHYPTIKSSLCGLLVFLLTYLAWVHIIYENVQHWVYPILAQLNWAERIGFHMFNVAVPVGFYFFGRYVNSRIWNENRVINVIQKSREEKLDIGSN